MTFRRIAVTGAAVAATIGCMAAAAASASALGPPAVYVRPIGYASEPMGPWQPLPAAVTSLGPYEIGVGIQPTTDISSRQAVEVDLASMPGGPAPADWQQRTPYSSYCALVTDAGGPISTTGDVLYFHGNGVYTLKVSAYTTAEWDARSGNGCSGGPASTVALTVAASGSVRVVGTPVVPRTTLVRRGFAGIELVAPAGAMGDHWRCALDPVRSADGPVTGSVVTSSSAEEAGAVNPRRDETVAFTRPGRWACSVQMLGGDFNGNVFGTPWTTTPTFIVHGQYERDPKRTVLTRLSHRRVRLVVPAAREVAAASVGGRLTLTIYRAGCRRGRLVLHRVLHARSVVDRGGVARFGFRTPARAAFYLGRPRFAGNTVLLASPDFDMPLKAAVDPAHPGGTPVFGFVSPRAWVPC